MLRASRNASLLSLVHSECSGCSSVCALLASGTTPCGQSSLPAVMSAATADSNGKGGATYVGILDVFKLGVGPSSSHTMGPMLATKQFVNMLENQGLLSRVVRITVDLYGSLALTGKGHATDRASVLGLAGFQPDSIDPDASDVVYHEICGSNLLCVNGNKRYMISFTPQEDVVFHTSVELPYHPNGMTVTAFGASVDDNACVSTMEFAGDAGVSLSVVRSETYYSIGGGFINTEAELIGALDVVDGKAAELDCSDDSRFMERTASPQISSLQRQESPTRSPPKLSKCDEELPGTRLLSDTTSEPSVEEKTPSPRSFPNDSKQIDLQIIQTSQMTELADVEDTRSTAPSSTPTQPLSFGTKRMSLLGSRPTSSQTNRGGITSCSGTIASEIPFPFQSAEELLTHATRYDLTIAEIMLRNECSWRRMSRAEVNSKIDALASTIDSCVSRGLRVEGRMPVSNIPRRAPRMHKILVRLRESESEDSMSASDWIALFARAVNEENACGGRVVTAPTNGAAGTLPAVLTYYRRFIKNSSMEGVRVFLATAAAIGSLCKRNASISGAEAGCQAEVGSACAMAAAGLCAVLGGSPFQIENAAEIGLEHCLGMTCDPISGLVQIPCIERNCVASVKAVLAARMALMGDGEHEVSLDSCVETMYRTGLDMQAKYRETSTGGLAMFARKLTPPVSPKGTTDISSEGPRFCRFDQALDF